MRLFNPIASIALPVTFALSSSLASAQSSFHRADFIGEDGGNAIAAMDLNNLSQFGMVIDAPSDTYIESALLLIEGSAKDLSIRHTNGVIHASVQLTDANAAAVRKGDAALVLNTSAGPLVQPITDVGTRSYGSGGSPTGDFPDATGTGHAVPGGTMAIVINGATPGRLGAFAFSAEQGSGEFAPGVPMHVGPIISTDLRVPDASGRVEWRLQVPATTAPGGTLYAQYIEVDGTGVAAASGGIRIQVRQAADVIVDRSPGYIELRTSNGLILTSADLNGAGEAIASTQTFVGADSDPNTAPLYPSAILAHPALNVMVTPLQNFDAPPIPNMDLAEAEQRALGGGIMELLGIWGLGWKTNGCTMIPFPTKFEDCCDAHDVLYGMGGNEADRLQADILLAECVLARTGSFDAMKLVFESVQAFGGNFFNYNGPPAPGIR